MYVHAACTCHLTNEWCDPLPRSTICLPAMIAATHACVGTVPLTHTHSLSACHTAVCRPFGIDGHGPCLCMLWQITYTLYDAHVPTIPRHRQDPSSPRVHPCQPKAAPGCQASCSHACAHSAPGESGTLAFRHYSCILSYVSRMHGREPWYQCRHSGMQTEAGAHMDRPLAWPIVHALYRHHSGLPCRS